MNIKKIRGDINLLLSQRKRLLTYATALSLTAAALTGCGDKEDSTTKYNNTVSYEDENQQDQVQQDMFTYESEKDGTVIMKGSISYDNLATLKMVRINNSRSEDEAFYICQYKDQWYLDIEHNKWVLSTDACSDKYYKYARIDYDTYSVNNFLLKHEKVKDFYSAEDFQEIKSEMIKWIKNLKEMFDYDYGEDGTVTMKGSISYDNFAKLEMVRINDKADDEFNEKFYICKYKDYNNYFDIEHNELIINKSNYEDYDYDTYSVNEFLLKQEKIKKFYSVKDFQKIKSEMINSIRKTSIKKRK